MAAIEAITHGDWSNSSTWDSGTVPTSGDVVTTSGWSVRIDDDIDAESIYGHFYIDTGEKTYTLNCDVLGELKNNIVSASSDTVIIINGDVGGGSNISGISCDDIGGPVSGDVYLTINGDVKSGIGSGFYAGVNTGDSQIPNYYITINGDVISTGWFGVRFIGEELIINGDIKAESGSYTGCVAIGKGVGIIDGDIYAANGVPGLSAASLGKAIIKGGNSGYTSADGTLPIGGTILLEDGVIFSIEMYTVETGTFTLTGDPPQILTNAPGDASPEPYDVRKGVIYGSKTGTLAVPNPLEVAFGIPTDNTVGQAAISLVQLSGITGEQIAAAFEK